MKIRKAEEKDILPVTAIFNEAKAYFARNGIDQWQKGYPNSDTVAEDIQKGIGYVLEDNEVIAYAVLIPRLPDPTYGVIYEGKWLSELPYGTIHRIAVKEARKGKRLATVFTMELEKICRQEGLRSIRVDTHRENLSMQRHLSKNGYQYCGIIHLADGDERLAYEKLL